MIAEEYCPDQVLVLAPVVLRVMQEGVDPYLTSEVKATFVYDPHGPLAVQLDIRELGKITTWVFARDLLDRGMRRGTGDGDIYIGRRYGQLRMVLSSGEEPVVMFCLLAPVKEFLERTYAVVPVEDEMCGFDDYVDDELLWMLREEESEG